VINPRNSPWGKVIEVYGRVRSGIVKLWWDTDERSHLLQGDDTAGGNKRLLEHMDFLQSWNTVTTPQAKYR